MQNIHYNSGNLIVLSLSLRELNKKKDAMLMNLKITNYRSLKNPVNFTMRAESSKSKEENVFVQPLSNTDEQRLLKVAAIYGPNASGKSNIIKCVNNVVNFIGKNRPDLGSKISAYDSFTFDSETEASPVEFCIEFILDYTKYCYEISFDRLSVVHEELIYYPNSRKKLLFERIVEEDKSGFHSGKLGSDFGSKNFKLFKNQAFLSKFGVDYPHDVISKVYLYITNNIEIVNSCDLFEMFQLRFEAIEKISNDKQIIEKVNSLVRFIDFGIEHIELEELDADKFKFMVNDDKDINKKLIEKMRKRINSYHYEYKNGEKIGTKYISLNEESKGTGLVFNLGIKIFETLEKGSTLFIDEIDASMHPELSRLLISLFQDERINSKNSQLIYTTHNTNLLDKNFLRKDQIWFTEKDKYGATDLYSLQDFSEVREDTPFEKWYLAGRFGAKPEFKSLENLYDELCR